MTTSPTKDTGGTAPGRNRTVLTVLAWAWVLIPFLYGVVMLVLKLPALF